MTTTPQLSSAVIKYGIAAIVGAVLVILFIRGCRNNPDTIKPPDTQASLDSLALVKRFDSTRLAWQRDSLRSVAEFKDMELELLSAQLINDGKQINQLSRLIQALRKDTGRTIYEESCDSLALIAPVYARLSDSFRVVSEEQRVLWEAERAAWAETDSLTNIAYLSAVDAAVKSATSYDLYRQQNKPRGQVYIGVGGVYQPKVQGVGGLLFYKDKRDRMIGGGYYITNGQPLYQVQVAVKINLKRR